MLALKIEPEYTMTTNKAEMNIDHICKLLWSTHWASDRPKAIIEKSVENAMCFGILYDDWQIGFARVITDYATFAYISDVVIDDNFQGKGFGSWLIESILEHPDLVEIPQWRLKTTNAKAFYKKLGFEDLSYAYKYVEILK
ncbi:MAG: GNAT family N-acetyltransferase [Peptostreptococcaceae bacterium]|nr:GNAT family N-acetyltransferase [Peptostreptococcaceae bacterium]